MTASLSISIMLTVLLFSLETYARKALAWASMRASRPIESRQARQIIDISSHSCSMVQLSLAGISSRVGQRQGYRAPIADGEILPAERPRSPFSHQSEESVDEAEDSIPLASIVAP